MPDSDSLRLGTRASQLAMWQANWVAHRLQQDGYSVEIVQLTTKGDVTSGPLDQAGGVGLFTRELQKALLDDRIDIAVHSLKDMPTTPVEGLVLGAVPLRASAQDVLVSRDYGSLDGLAPGAKVGTGSNRRRAQLLHHREDINVVGIRGNVDTRLRKLDDGEYDAIVLAEAGLVRLGCENRISQRIPMDICLPAPGQGALGLEIRENDQATLQAVSAIDDLEQRAATTAERAFLAAVEAGCSSPAAAWATFDSEDALCLHIAIFHPEGTSKVANEFRDHPSLASQLGEQAAAWALANGADELLRL